MPAMVVSQPTSQRPLTTLQRGLRLLEAIAARPGTMTAKQLSLQLEIRLGTCYHLLRTLQEEGYVVRLPGGQFDLNGRVAYLQDGLRSRLIPDLQVLEVLRGLHERLNETTCVCGWYREEIVVQWYLEPVRALHARSLEIGYGSEPHARASTRAVLAYLPESRVRAYLAGRVLHALTPKTITDVDVLMENLRDVARRGYCIDREEVASGLCCIGTPYFDTRAFPLGSFSIAAPLHRFDEAADRIVAEVVGAAREASMKYGYSGPFPPRSPLLAAI